MGIESLLGELTYVGDVLYEKEDEPGVFYDGQDNPISYAAALSAGLISNPAIHTGDATIAGDSNYQFAGR